jgi:dTDP-4-dehydrorhamnose 3,5-epimerase
VSQINTAFSRRAGTLRGMHYQLAPHAENKFVRCTRGALYDVALDLRPESPTFKAWFGVELTAEDGRMLWIPEGCAHGYQTLSDATELLYLTSRAYEPAQARGVRYDDPAFGVAWPLEVRVISDADRGWPDFGV